MLSSQDAQLQRHNAPQLLMLRQLKQLGYDVNALCSKPELLGAVAVVPDLQLLIHILYNQMNENDTLTDRSYGLELMAVFHTMAINLLICECTNRLGSNGVTLAKSLYMTWVTTVDLGYQQHLDILKKRLTAEVYAIAENDMLQTKLKAQQDILAVLNLKLEDVSTAAENQQ